MLWLEDKDGLRCWCAQTGVEIGVINTADLYYQVDINSKIISPAFTRRADAERFYMAIINNILDSGDIIRSLPFIAGPRLTDEERQNLLVEKFPQKPGTFDMTQIGLPIGDLLGQMLGPAFSPVPVKLNVTDDEYKKAAKDLGVE
jgi:hypothetical protein